MFLSALAERRTSRLITILLASGGGAAFVWAGFGLGYGVGELILSAWLVAWILAAILSRKWRSDGPDSSEGGPLGPTGGRGSPMGDTYHVKATGDHGTAIGKQENHYAPRAEPRVIWQDLARTAKSLTLRVVIDPPNASVPHVTLFCSDPFALRGVPLALVNRQHGVMPDGRHFEGFASPVFPFTMEIATAATDPFLGYAFKPVVLQTNA